MSKRKITVAEMDYIGPLGTFGPIVTPTYYDESIVHRLVQRNYSVTEHSDDPATKGKKIKLTINNFNDPKRFQDDTFKPMDRTNLTGAPAAGKATIVNPVAPEVPVTIPEEKPQDETPVTVAEAAAAPEVKEAPTANPINNTNLTKKQRKELARKAAEEKAKANKENAESNATADEQVTAEIPQNDEETASEPVSLKD